ncbi:MAG: glycosyltransferase family 2 protein [Candidatus Humimicrobiaceae bacterium]
MNNNSKIIKAESTCEIQESVYLSVVIPVFNERENISYLYENLNKVLPLLCRKYEVLLIDDGSSDGTFDELVKIHEQNDNYKVIKFRKNFGQTPAMSAGFDYANGEIIITLDADLQNDPQDIPLLIEKMNEGFDVVSGWRINRQDKAMSRKLPSKVANWLIAKLTGVKIHDYGCTLKAYSRDVVKNIELYGEMHRYIPAVASWMGISVAEVPVHHHSRKFGKSKYGISRTIRVILDIIILKYLLTYSQKPIQIFGLIGLFTGLVGGIITIYLIIMRLFFNVALSSRPLFTLSIFMIFIGVQLITMGILGELLMRTYHEASGKPTYAIKQILD